MKLKLVGAIGVFALLFQTFFLSALADETKLFPSLTGDQGQTTAVSTIGTPEIKTITTTTSSTNTTTSTSPLRPPQKIEQTVQRSIDITDTTAHPLVRARIDQRLARKMAKDHWLEKAVAADPSLIDAITQYSSAAKILAKHPRIGTIAEADHYTCRNITRWKTASRNLARNPEVKEVIDCDPEGIYRAIKRDSKIGKLLVKQPDFNQIIVDNPELGKLLATHM
jgi:hypothetical protein